MAIFHRVRTLSHERRASSGSVKVIYEIATDEAFTTIIAQGDTMTDESTDWTVRIKPTGLSALTAGRLRASGR